MAPHIQGPLYFEQLGREGRPMLFVHPNPLDLSCWLYQTARFSFWYRTLAIDLPGYGRSPRAEPGLTLDDMAEACWECADQVSEEPAIVVGLSVGSWVAQFMARQRPHQTAAVIICGIAYEPGISDVAERRVAPYTERGMAYRDEHILEDFSPAFRSTPLGRYFAAMFRERDERADAASIVEIMRALSLPRPEDLQSCIKAPALLVTASLDRGHQRAKALQERISGCELATIADAGHASNMEQPWAWDSAVLAFLSRHGLFPGGPQG